MAKKLKLWEVMPKIEQVAIEDIIEYEFNAKKHPKSQVKAIAASIDRYGWGQPLAINKNNVLIIGHGRVAAARLLGAKWVPCFRMEDLTEEQANELRIADNKLNESEWDELKLSESLKGLGGPVLEMLEFPKLNFDMKPVEFMERLDKKIKLLVLIVAMNFKIALCSFEAAKYAVMNWHYSRTMPAGKLIKFGAWEDNQFIGTVIFGRGANNHIAQEFGLSQVECVELVRVALKLGHKTTVSRVVAICLKILKKSNPGIRLIVSYADENQGHHGGIYQAGNWHYLGARNIELGIRIDGRIYHRRSISAKYGNASLDFLRTKFKNVEIAKGKPKHKYVYLFDKSLYDKLTIFPYPVRQSSSGSSA